MGFFDFLKDAFGSPVKKPAKPIPPPPPPPAAAASPLARALGLSDRELRWLADPWWIASVKSPHYHAFQIPKRRGGMRTILAPKTKLKRVQRMMLDHILYTRGPLDAAHGFVKGRSIRTNAAPHAGRQVVVKADLVDFFHTIGFPRVRGLFKEGFKYSHEDATLLAQLATAPVARQRNAGDYFGRTGGYRRVAVQGAPTSPAIANLICRGLDARLAGLAREFKAAYTRYADDLTFSGDAEFKNSLPWFLPLLAAIVEDEGFKLSKRKFVVARAGRRQSVTGLTVNKRVAVDRRYVRRLKAILHNCRKTGPAKQARGLALPKFRARLEGQIDFVKSIDPAKGAKLEDAFIRIAWA